AALGRPLGAVPGPVTSAASAGCHRLIREYGAVCVTTVDEMVELVGDSVPGAEPGGGGRGSDEIRVLDALSVRSVRTPEDVAVRTGLPVDTVHSTLGILELDARVAERPGGWVYLPQAR